MPRARAHAHALIVAASVASLLGAVPLHAQSAGVSRLPDSAVARIDGAFASLATGETPGCAVGAARRGETVLTRAYGLANLEYGVPNTPETIFESGSVAKQFTAAAVALLASEGRLSLDDDVRRHLPEVPDFKRTIRVRHLLTHTSGLRDQWGLLGIKGSPPGSQVHSLPLILDLVGRQKSLNFDPGSEYLYSNTGYALAAIIVQRASGKSLAQFSAERFFAPLGMTSTAWRDDYTRVVKNRATAYDRGADGRYRADMPFTNVYGNGGLLTTVGDLLKWNAYLDSPAAAIGGPALVRAMETPMTLTGGRPITYALGLTVASRDGVREVSHGGSTAGYRTWLARYPGERVSVAVLCNDGTANPTALGGVVAAQLVSRPARAAIAAADSAAAMSTAELARYTGLFRAPRTQGVLRVVARDGRLVTEVPAGVPLAASGTDRFRFGNQGAELAYRFASGRVRDVTLVTEGDSTRFEPVAAPPLTPRALASYAGSYWSEELETRVTVAVRDSTLVVKRRPAEETVLRPLFADGFSGSGVGTVVFSRDRRGAVDGFGIWAGRVRDVRFVRER